MPVVFIGVVSWRDATIAILSEKTPHLYKSHYLSFTTVIVFVAPLSAVRRKR